MAGAGDALDLRAQRVGGERAGGQDGAARAVLVLESRRVTSSRMTRIDGSAAMASVMRRENSTRSTASAWPAGTARLIGNAQQSRAGAAHLLLEQPGRGVGRFALERVGADQFAEIRGLVGGCQARLPVDDGRIS